MELIVCAVRDSAADGYARPFYMPSRAMALRGFADEVNNPQSPMYTHPKDYELFELGSWSEETGRFVNLDVPRSIVRAVDVRKEDK